jgi:hypothetical protein
MSVRVLLADFVGMPGPGARGPRTGRRTRCGHESHRLDHRLVIIAFETGNLER